MVAAHADRWRRLETKKPGDAFSEGEHKHLTAAAVLIMHEITSLLYVPIIYAGQWKNTSMLVKKHPFSCCPAETHPKHLKDDKLAVTDIRKISEPF